MASNNTIPNSFTVIAMEPGTPEHLPQTWMVQVTSKPDAWGFVDRARLYPLFDLTKFDALCAAQRLASYTILA